MQPATNALADPMLQKLKQTSSADLLLFLVFKLGGM
jgi:hypothetical protein